MKKGRPTRYKPEFARMARSLCSHGIDNIGLAEAFSVSVATLYRWLDRYPKFGLAVAMGRGDHAGLKEPSLYKRAIGYAYRAERVYRANTPDPVAVDCDQHVLADPTAALRWLRNRCPGEWRVKATGKGRTDPAPD